MGLIVCHSSSSYVYHSSRSYVNKRSTTRAWNASCDAISHLHINFASSVSILRVCDVRWPLKFCRMLSICQASRFSCKQLRLGKVNDGVDVIHSIVFVYRSFELGRKKRLDFRFRIGRMMAPSATRFRLKHIILALGSPTCLTIISQAPICWSSASVSSYKVAMCPTKFTYSMLRSPVCIATKESNLQESTNGSFGLLDAATCGRATLASQIRRVLNDLVEISREKAFLRVSHKYGSRPHGFVIILLAVSRSKSYKYFNPFNSGFQRQHFVFFDIPVR